MSNFKTWLETITRRRVVLLVDDSLDDCELIMDRSSRFHVEFVTTNTQAQALRELESREVDLIMLDLVLGPDSGVTLFRLIKERWPNVPVLVLSGHISTEMVQRVTEIGFAIFALKPLSFTEEFFAQLYSTLNIPEIPAGVGINAKTELAQHG